MDHASIEQHFAVALDGLIEDVKKDRSILAAILCGSLSHDTVWAKSDIDLVLVTIDDKKVKENSVSLYADGVNIHAILTPRSRFRSMADGAIRNSFMHSFLAKGRLLYTHDETIAALCSRLGEIGERDTRIQLLRAGTHALGPMYKAHKWLLTREDLDYSALWILYAATPLAQIEVIGRRLLADREVIPQALRLNPGFFRIVYADLLNEKKNRSRIEAALEAMDAYVRARAPTLFAPVIDYLRDAGEVRSCTEIEHHFERNHGITGVTLVCEYLADQDLIGKASVAVQLTKRSNIEVQELAFYSLAKE
jgi:polymorphic toxin system nucleotidyltransferase-like protein